MADVDAVVVDESSPGFLALSDEDKAIARGPPPVYTQQQREQDERDLRFHCPLSRSFPSASRAVIWHGADLDNDHPNVFSVDAVNALREGPLSSRRVHPITRQAMDATAWDNIIYPPIPPVMQNALLVAKTSYESREAARLAHSNYRRVFSQMDATNRRHQMMQNRNQVRQQHMNEGQEEDDRQRAAHALAVFQNRQNTGRQAALNGRLPVVPPPPPPVVNLDDDDDDDNPPPPLVPNAVINLDDNEDEDDNGEDDLSVQIDRQLAQLGENMDNRNNQNDDDDDDTNNNDDANNEDNLVNNNNENNNNNPNNNNENNNNEISIQQRFAATNPLRHNGGRRARMPRNFHNGDAAETAFAGFLRACELMGWGNTLAGVRTAFMRQNIEVFFQAGQVFEACVHQQTPIIYVSFLSIPLSMTFVFSYILFL